MAEENKRSPWLSKLQTLGLALLIALIATGCAPKKHIPVEIQVYEGRPKRLKAMDTECLKGKKIVIDPGHGGVFRGAIGNSGVSEADVNLGVGLYLWGLLEEAGCQVWLTRKTDKDLVDGDASKLREDLQRRIEFSNKIGPDLFISLHHNADPNRDLSRNEIQVYYKMDDTGPSRDIALTIAKHIRLNIADVTAVVKPGNYYVLRNSIAPAVLCEPSFISNPQVESKLRLSEKQRLEAEVYFNAIVEYFSRGVPKAAQCSPTGTHEDVASVAIRFESEPSIDPNSAVIEIDGIEVPACWLSANTLVAPVPFPLSNGIHTVAASVRSTTGNSSPRVHWDFTIDRPAQEIFVDLVPKKVAPGCLQQLVVRPLDRYGKPVRDSKAVLFGWKDGSFETEVKHGCAIVFRGRQIPFDAESIQISCDQVTKKVDLSEDLGSNAISGLVVDCQGNPLGKARILVASQEKVIWTDTLGFFWFEADIPETIYVSKAGFKRLSAVLESRSVPNLILEPLYSDLKPQARVAIDPGESMGESSWLTKEGKTSSELNLEVATYLKNCLEQYGIEVILTRRDQTYVPEIDRVRTIERFGPDLAISIMHQQANQPSMRLEHYPSSVQGRHLAVQIADYFKKISGSTASISETSDYIIQQTTCPTVRITIGEISRLDSQDDRGRTYHLFQKCYPILCGLLIWLGVDPMQTFEVSGTVYQDGHPAKYPIVEIDGCILIPADKDGNFRAHLLEKGCHELRAICGNRSSERLRVCEAGSRINLNLK